MSSIKEVICICCPCGCHLQVDPENDYNVKTAQAVPKEKMTEVMAALDRVTLHAPVRTGQVVLADVCGTGVDVVATRNL